MRLFFISVFLFLYFVASAQNSSIQFQSLDEVFAYADKNSSTFKNATQQSILAKYQTLAAKLAQWNFKGDAVFVSTDNTKLPVSYIPADIFPGGQPGTFRQVTFGQQYVSSLNFTPQIDILNPYSFAKVKVAKNYEAITNLTNQLTKKNLYESLAGAYYNILSYQWQIGVTEKSLANADTLLQIMQQKQKEGLARIQDANGALANQLATQDKLQQLEILLAQQYNSLKILCDIDASTAVSVLAVPKLKDGFDASLTASGHLQQEQSEAQKKYQESDWRAAKKWYMPTLSLVGNVAWQQTSNTQFYNSNPWINSSYIGFKFVLPIVPDANKIATTKYGHINMIIADINMDHAALQDSINNEQLLLDYKKSFRTYELNGKIEALKEDNYHKNLDIYKEGILSATDLINSFNDWLNSGLNTVAQLANTEYAKSKIKINNSIK